MKRPHVPNAAIAGRERSVEEFIPMRAHLTDHIVTGEGGTYMRAWRLDGIAFEAADDTDINARHDGFNQFLRSLCAEHPGIAIWSHRIRRRINDRLRGHYDNAWCDAFNDRHNDRLQEDRMMANELYITVLLRPTQEETAMTRWFGRASAPSRADVEAAQRDAIAKLDAIAYQLESSLRRYGPHALGVYRAPPQSRRSDRWGIAREGMLCSAALELFGFLVNGHWGRVPVRRSRIHAYLPTSRIFAGHAYLEIHTPSAVRFASVLDFSDYPEEAEPGILNPILYDDYEYIETQSFSMLPRYSALEALKRQRNQLVTSEDPSRSQVAGIGEAIEEVVNGSYVMGDYHYTVAVLGDTIDDVARNAQRVRTALQDQGFQMKAVDLVPDSAWFAQLPGNWRFRPREAQISSRVFCGLSAFHNFASGKRDGNPWGEAVAILKTPSGQPFYFNFHSTPEDHDSEDDKAIGNTMIVGMSGAGKTVVKLALLAQAMKYQPTVILFDKDRGEEIAVRAMGGKYAVIRRQEPTGFNPFKLDPTRQNIDFWVTLVRRLITLNGPALSPSDEQSVVDAVHTVAGFDRTLRGLTTVCQNLPAASMNSLNMRLQKWCRGGELGWVLDCPENLHDFSTHRLHGFDYTEFLDDPEIRTPVMMYLMHLTESQIAGQRFIYGMAEFWKPLNDPVFTEFVKNKQKTIRKQNGLGIFDTQSPSDALDSPIARTLIEQCGTLIFMANPKASREDYVGGFKLTEAEFEIVRSLGEHSRMFLIKQGHRSAVAHLDLSGMTEELNVLSGSTDNIELLDRIREEMGTDDPAAWLPVLHERIAARRNARPAPGSIPIGRPARERDGVAA